MKPHHFALLLAALFFTAPVHAQNTILWEAYNDYRPTDDTHANATGYDLRLTDDGGPLKNFETGAELGATITVISEGDVEPNDFGLNFPNTEAQRDMAPWLGSPAYELFNGKVVIGNDGLAGMQERDGVKITTVFSGLDASKRYIFRATVSRGGNYDDRWSVFGITGTEAHVAAHIDASDNQNLITAETFPEAGLAAHQVALNSGDNKVGSLVGWDNIEPGADGTFEIVAQQWGGPTPFGNAPRGVTERYGYSLTAIYLAEIESTGSLRIIANPPPVEMIPAGETATLLVEAESPDTVTYQWQAAAPGSDAFEDIGGATDATYTTPVLQVADHESRYRCVVRAGGFELLSSETLVEVDGETPAIAAAEGSINFDSVYLTFSEPMKLALLANRSNYTIEGLFINDVTVRDASTVRLHTSPQPKAVNYAVSVKEVEDLAGNKVDPNASLEFKTFTFANEAVGLEIWENVGGGAINDLRNFPRFPNQPDVDFSTSTIDSVALFGDGPNNTYGGRFRAWLIPDETTNYHFFLRGDDNAEFRIGENSQFAPLEDPDRFPDALASANNPFQEPDTDESTSEPIALEAGKKYAVEVIWKEANGGDRAQLAWRKVGDNTPAENLEPIPSEFFCYFGSKFFDSDNDGLSDAYEVLNGLDANKDDANGDLDGDGLTNIEEHDLGTAADLADTDNDGLEDGVETRTGIYVNEQDTGSDPQIADTDTDTLDDGAEIAGGTNPNKADTDDDTFADNVELALSTDPVNAASKPEVTIAVDTGAWDNPGAWSDGQAPRAGRDYVVVNSVTAEISAVPGDFAGDSITLIGPGMALRANHEGESGANIVLNDTELKIRNSNTLNGKLTLNGRILFDGQEHTFVLGAPLNGAPLLTIQGNDEGIGTIELAGASDNYAGLTTISGTSVIASGEGSLGTGSITLVSGGLTFGYDLNNPQALLKIRGGNFTLGLEGNVVVADLVGVNENDAQTFSLFDVAGPGPYTAADLVAVFQTDEDSVTGEGTLTLEGNTGDTDIDGLPDAWENANFGNLDVLPGDDPDGDGLINLAELAGETDPNVADTPDPVEPPDSPNPPAGDRPVIGAVTKNANEVSLAFPAGTTFDVEYSEDLETWEVIATAVTGNFNDDDAGRTARGDGYYRGVVKE